MAITKETEVDKIDVLEMGQVQVRTATVLTEDGTELNRSCNRHVLDHKPKTVDNYGENELYTYDARNKTSCDIQM